MPLVIDGTTDALSSTGTAVIVDDNLTLTGSLQSNGSSVTVNSNLTVTGLITEQSSIAYKENVQPIDNALEFISQLSGVLYDKKDRTSTNEAGLIAEDVSKVLPNLVSYKDGNPDGVLYSRLTAYLIEAIKELKSELDTLKNNQK